MLFTTTDGVSLTPEQIGELLVQPVYGQAVALNPLVSTSVTTASPHYRVPIVAADPSAAWTLEGQEIPLSDAAFQELVITPSKIAGQTVISLEASQDTTPAAVPELLDAIQRDLARKIDQAFWGTVAAPAPSGLPTLAGVGTVDAGGSWQNLDPFAEAISNAQRQYATLTAFVANPADALALATIKTAATWNQPLLGTDATNATERRVQGVPLIVSPYVTEGTIWGVDASRIRVVVRQEADLVTSDQALFTSQRIVIQGTIRLGWGFPHPASVQKISLA